MQRLATVFSFALSAAQTPAGLYRQGVELHQQGRLEQAAGLYRRVLEAHPDSVVARSNPGAALSAVGR